MENQTTPVDFARCLVWLKRHGPLSALALFVLIDGGSVSHLMGAIC